MVEIVGVVVETLEEAGQLVQQLSQATDIQPSS
jgi:hypothetical protein